MAWGRRCDLGCMTWPDEKRFETCPTCGQPTERFNNLTVADDDEISQALFDAFYKEWDESHSPNRLLMTPEESLKWDQKYPHGRPDNAPRLRKLEAS